MNSEMKTCPKCGDLFGCNNYNILKCDCALVPLSAEIRQKISEKYDDCLCLKCLKEYSAMEVSD